MKNSRRQAGNSIDHDFQEAWGGALTDLSSDCPFASVEEKKPVSKLDESSLLTGEMADDQFLEIFKSWLFEGKVLSALHGVSKSQLETVYAVAYRYYSVGEYLGAIELFRWLVTMDHYNNRYSFGLAGSLQAAGFYQDAIAQYLLLYLQDPKNPEIPLHAGICHLALKNYSETKSALVLAKELSEGESGKEECYERACSLQDHVNEILSRLGSEVKPSECAESA